MRAVAHGWKPSRMKGPTRAVAKEFVNADKRRDNVTGYQFGGGVPYRGVPPQRGMMSRGATGNPYAMADRMRGQMPRGGVMGGQYNPGGSGPFVPGGGGRGPYGPSIPPNQRGTMDRMGALRQAMQQRGGPGGPKIMGGSGPFVPGGGRPPEFPGGDGLPPGIDPRAVAADPGGWERHQADPRFAAQQARERMSELGGPGGGKIGGGGSGPFIPRGEDPRGRMNQAQNRFGALTQGAPRGGGMMGRKPMPRRGAIPGRRMAGPPGKFPGGGNPNLRGRNPMISGAGRFGGGRGTWN